MSFGFDMAADFADAFAGDLFPATIKKRRTGNYDQDDPSSGPATDDTIYTANAIAFQYDEELIATEQVANTMFLVTIMVGSIRLASTSVLERYIPVPGDIISIPPPGQSVAVDAIVSAIRSLTEVAATCVVGGQIDG